MDRREALATALAFAVFYVVDYGLWLVALGKGGG